MTGDFLGRLVAREIGRAAIVSAPVPPPFLSEGPAPGASDPGGDDGWPATVTPPPHLAVDRHALAAVPAAVALGPAAPADRVEPAAAASATPPGPPLTEAPASPLATTAPAPAAARSAESTAAPAAPVAPVVATGPGMRLRAPADVVASVPLPESVASAGEAAVPERRHESERPSRPAGDGAGARQRVQPAAPPPNERSPGRAPAGRSVRITIGRLEVRAPAPSVAAVPGSADGSRSAPPAPPPSAATGAARRVRPPSRSLDDYLRERRGRR